MKGESVGSEESSEGGNSKKKLQKPAGESTAWGTLKTIKEVT